MPRTDPTAVANELHRLANLIAEVDPSRLLRAYVSFSAPATSDDASAVEWVDDVAFALGFDPAKTGSRVGDRVRYEASLDRPGADVSVWTYIADPVQRDKDAEIARLTAELAELRATATRRGGTAPVTDANACVDHGLTFDTPEDVMVHVMTQHAGGVLVTTVPAN